MSGSSEGAPVLLTTSQVATLLGLQPETLNVEGPDFLHRLILRSSHRLESGEGE